MSTGCRGEGSGFADWEGSGRTKTVACAGTFWSSLEIVRIFSDAVLPRREARWIWRV